MMRGRIHSGHHPSFHPLHDFMPLVLTLAFWVALAGLVLLVSR